MNSSGIQPTPGAKGSWAGKMTVPTRRSEELARIERLLVDDGLENGNKTRAMETVSLIEAEREIARQARESEQPGGDAHAEVAEPVTFRHAVESNVAPTSEVVPLTAPPVGSSSIASPPREQRRRFVATLIVSVVMLAALALAGIGLARKGWPQITSQLVNR